MVAIANFVMTLFGGSVIIGQPSNGTVTIRVGGPSTLRVHVVLDLFAYLGPDQ